MASNVFPDGVVRCFTHNLPAKLSTSQQPRSRGRKFYECSLPREDGRHCQFFYWKDELDASFPSFAEEDRVKIAGASQGPSSSFTPTQAQAHVEVAPLSPPQTQYVPPPARVSPQSSTETLRSQTLPSPEPSPVFDRVQAPRTPPRNANSDVEMEEWTPEKKHRLELIEAGVQDVNRSTKRVDEQNLNSPFVERPAVRSSDHNANNTNPSAGSQLHTPPPTGHRDRRNINGKARAMDVDSDDDNPFIQGSPTPMARIHAGQVQLAQGGLGGRVLKFPQGGVEANPAQRNATMDPIRPRIPTDAVEEAPNAASTSASPNAPDTLAPSSPISIDQLNRLAGFAHLFDDDLRDTLRALPEQVSKLMEALERSERRRVANEKSAAAKMRRIEKLNEEIEGLRRSIESSR